MAKQVAAGKVRVIGGKWRGRRLPLADAAIRPTADRVRETLFNWLDPHLRGANVLDLFAGSGALGFESASRGAANVVLVEKSRGTAEHLRRLVAELDAAEVTVRNEEARRYLASPDRLPARQYDVVFLDPPFAGHELAELCSHLEQGSWLSPTAHVYLEMASNTEFPDLPEKWLLLKNKTAGQVCYALARREA
jgi:16S rRNA (guanine966-N2)-methyltransferase